MIYASKKFNLSNQDKLKEIETKTHYNHIPKTKYKALHCSNYNVGNFLVLELGWLFHKCEKEEGRERKGNLGKRREGKKDKQGLMIGCAVN